MFLVITYLYDVNNLFISSIFSYFKYLFFIHKIFLREREEGYMENKATEFKDSISIVIISANQRV